MMLDMLEKRLAGVEERLGTVVDGIANIVSKLGACSRDHWMDAGVQTSTRLGRLPVAHVHAGLYHVRSGVIREA